MKLVTYRELVSTVGFKRPETFQAALNLTNRLIGDDPDRHAQAKDILRQAISTAPSVIGAEHEVTLSLRCNYAVAVQFDNLAFATNTFKDVLRIARRVLGNAHPKTSEFERMYAKVLDNARRGLKPKWRH